jgi:hypothetical protein
VSDTEAVLHPMSRYYGLVDGLEAQKQEYNAQQEIIVALIGGVAADGSVHYGEVGSTDPDYQNSFGIGPGCEAPPPMGSMEPVQAVPPVRLRDMVNRYSEGNMFSICESDYSPALEAIAERIRDQIQPACYTKCVKDTDASTVIVDPECTVEESRPGEDDPARIEECATDAGGAYIIDQTTNDYAMPSDDINVCYALLTDDVMSTASTADDMSPECSDQNFNLEFKISRRPGFPAAGGTAISATCSLADFPDVTCPGIGG